MLQIVWHTLIYSTTDEITSEPIPIPDEASSATIKLDATHGGTLDIDYMGASDRQFHQDIVNANSGTQARSVGGNNFYIEPAGGTVIRLRWASGTAAAGTLTATVDSNEPVFSAS